MATEILVNDGGAPARIIPVEAAEAIVAGDAVAFFNVASSDAKVKKCDSGEATHNIFAGVALTDAALGAKCNIVTGRGVVCRVKCADVAGGVALMPSTTDGELATWAGHATNVIAGNIVAIAMEDGALGGGGAGLIKCLLVG